MDYIRDVAGCRTVPVEVGSRYTDEEWSQTLMTVSEFISKYITGEVGGPAPSGRACRQAGVKPVCGPRTRWPGRQGGSVACSPIWSAKVLLK